MTNKTIFFLLSTFTFLQANAQKLPNVQRGSLRAPAGIKIDGKATDWGDKFEANNPTTELLYTIANDDKKLYLLAQTDVQTVINRICSGGIKLVVQKNGLKSETGAPFVKFPFLEKGTVLTFNLANTTRRMVQQGNTGRYVAEDVPPPASQAESDKLADSVMRVNNKKLTGTLKLIYTNGIARVDSLVPVYNDKGIEAATAFDNKKVFTYEIAIDLKLLGLSADKAEKFSYHLVVNGEPNKYSPAMPVILGITAPDGTPGSAEEVRAANEKTQSRFAPRGATTEFWGEYTLAK